MQPTRPSRGMRKEDENFVTNMDVLDRFLEIAASQDGDAGNGENTKASKGKAKPRSKSAGPSARSVKASANVGTKGATNSDRIDVIVGNESESTSAATGVYVLAQGRTDARDSNNGTTAQQINGVQVNDDVSQSTIAQVEASTDTSGNGQPGDVRSGSNSVNDGLTAITQVPATVGLKGIVSSK